MLFELTHKKIRKLVDKEVRKKVGEEEKAGNLHE